MKFYNLRLRLVLLFSAIAVAFSLAACADNPATANCPDNNRVNQAFSFSMLESPDVEILDYFYGIPNCPAFSNPEQYKKRGKSMQGENTMGPFRRAHKLYVKWHLKNTEQEYEETVDLRQRLPADMTGYRVHFTIKETQLYVYLIAPERRLPDMPAIGPKAYQSNKTTLIYPDQSN